MVEAVPTAVEQSSGIQADVGRDLDPMPGTSSMGNVFQPDDGPVVDLTQAEGSAAEPTDEQVNDPKPSASLKRAAGQDLAAMAPATSKRCAAQPENGNRNVEQDLDAVTPATSMRNAAHRENGRVNDPKPSTSSMSSAAAQPAAPMPSTSSMSSAAAQLPDLAVLPDPKPTNSLTRNTELVRYRMVSTTSKQSAEPVRDPEPSTSSMSRAAQANARPVPVLTPSTSSMSCAAQAQHARPVPVPMPSSSSMSLPAQRNAPHVPYQNPAITSTSRAVQTDARSALNSMPPISLQQRDDPHVRHPRPSTISANVAAQAEARRVLDQNPSTEKSEPKKTRSLSLSIQQAKTTPIEPLP